MATPHYVVKKVGDRYVMVRKDSEPRVDLPCAAIGALLLWRGVRRRRFPGTLAALAGSLLMFRGWTGHLPLRGRPAGSRRAPRSAAGPSFQHDLRPQQQTPKDEVDEAVMESFPASDPPARTGRAVHF